VLPGEPGIHLKEALEKARVLFYKVKILIQLKNKFCVFNISRVNKLLYLLIHMAVMLYEFLMKMMKQ